MVAKQTGIDFHMQPDAESESAIPVMQYPHLAPSMPNHSGRDFGRTWQLLVANLRHILIGDVALKHKLACRPGCQKSKEFGQMDNG